VGDREARERGAKVITFDPRFAVPRVADILAPLARRIDILFSSGGLIHYVLENKKDFASTLIPTPNASIILPETFKDTEGFGRRFSGCDVTTNRRYDEAVGFRGLVSGWPSGAQEAPELIRVTPRRAAEPPADLRDCDCGPHAKPSTLVYIKF